MTAPAATDPATASVRTPGSNSPRPESHHARRLRRRAALREVSFLIGLLLTAGTLYGALVLLPSKLRTAEQRARRDVLVAEVTDLEGSIRTLQRDAQALHDDPWVVERALRGRLGYLRPGERVFRSGER